MIIKHHSGHSYTTQSLYVVERNNNDLRKDKIIHPFDGRVIPLNPTLLKQHAEALAEKLNLEGVDYILGFAEGGLISAYAISEVTNIPFIGSYRVRLKLDNEIHFQENHSERANHFIYGLHPNDKIVIIEDEITTGQTLINVIAQLQLRHIEVQDIGVYALNCSTEVLAKFEESGYYIKSLYTRDDIQPPCQLETSI